jgi:hypothetical protein
VSAPRCCRGDIGGARLHAPECPDYFPSGLPKSRGLPSAVPGAASSGSAPRPTPEADDFLRGVHAAARDLLAREGRPVEPPPTSRDRTDLIRELALERDASFARGRAEGVEEAQRAADALAERSRVAGDTGARLYAFGESAAAVRALAGKCWHPDCWVVAPCPYHGRALSPGPSPDPATGTACHHCAGFVGHPSPRERCIRKPGCVGIPSPSPPPTPAPATSPEIEGLVDEYADAATEHVRLDSRSSQEYRDRARTALVASVSALVAERDEAKRDLDAVGHALGICYDHDHGCGGAGPVEEMVRAAKEGCAAQGEAIDARARAEKAEAALREVVRRAGLPITPNVSGMPDTAEVLVAAIAKCARLVAEHVAEPARALSSPPSAPTPSKDAAKGETT